MRKKEQTGIGKYLVLTFGIAWAMQAGVAALYRNGNAAVGQLLMAAMMFVPALGAVLAGGRLSGMGWRPQIRKNIRAILFAWFMPCVLTAVGAALYFLIFPGHFDLSGSMLAASGGREVLEQMDAQGMSYPTYILLSIVSCLTYAPLINMFLGLGEEIGWRGFLYPALKAKLGRRMGWILGGIIWGAWHWPLIWLIGYEYGTDYIGFPGTGMLLFCIFTIVMGILCDWLYEKSGSIWLPSLFHGAVNAAATVPLGVCLAGTGSARLLGPVPNGLIAGLPFIAAAAVLIMKNEA